MPGRIVEGEAQRTRSSDSAHPVFTFEHAHLHTVATDTCSLTKDRS